MHPLFHPLYIEYCTYFNGNRDYFECHEVLEDYWKQVAPGEKEHPLVGYIQIATGMYHWRRGNLRGASKMLANGYQILSTTTKTIFIEKINREALLYDVQNAINAIQLGASFEAFEIEITDEELSKAVAESFSDMPNLEADFIRNKHLLRDRTEVLEAREKSIETKKQLRE